MEEAQEPWQREQTAYYDEYMRGTLARVAHIAAPFGRLAVEKAVDLEISNNTDRADQIMHDLTTLHETHSRRGQAIRSNADLTPKQQWLRDELLRRGPEGFVQVNTQAASGPLIPKAE